LAEKLVTEMIYNVSSGMLNRTQLNWVTTFPLQ